MAKRTGGIEMSEINTLRDEVHQNAVEHGWWDNKFSDAEITTIESALKKFLDNTKESSKFIQKVIQKANEQRHIGSLLMLMVSELSEVLEEYRNGHKPTETYYSCEKDWDCGLYEPGGENKECFGCPKHKPEGIPIELADCIIRILDYCGAEKIDMDEAIRIKKEYNKTRPFRHGGKKI
jgi:NTP pyrophosphatase (non-canonical NTP hydrolase)